MSTITADSSVVAADSSVVTADGGSGIVPFIVSITIDDVIDALAVFLQPFVGTAEIIRAQTNRVPMPHGACVVLTELLHVDIETPTSEYDVLGSTQSILNPSRVDVQIDFYGKSAGDQCKAVKSVFRSAWAYDQYPNNIAPLYCGDGMQTPLITGEQQWESRWTLTASLQYNPTVWLPQQFADTLNAALIEVDAVYPP